MSLTLPLRALNYLAYLQYFQMDLLDKAHHFIEGKFDSSLIDNLQRQTFIEVVVSSFIVNVACSGADGAARETGSFITGHWHAWLSVTLPDKFTLDSLSWAQCFLAQKLMKL